MASSSSKKKTFDVSKPGKSSPEATARPIIVSNRSIVKDPTLTQGDRGTIDPEVSSVAENKPVAPSKIVSSQAKTIQPLSSQIDEESVNKAEDQKGIEDKKISEPVDDDKESSQTDKETDEPKEDVEETSKPVVDDEQSNKSDKPEDESKKSNDEVEASSETPKDGEESDKSDNTDEELEKPNDSDSSDSSSEIDSALANKKEENKQTAEEKAHKELVEKLVAEGKFVVPIGQIKHRQNTRNLLMVFALMLIVGVVAANLLIDAGTIQTDIKPIVDLIKN